ncbi:MAG TPA: ubiquinone/menaquinone biosynthesis methyltransferase [Solirubrobacteraceae bacterium]|jgi:demethylmenaquinone methyltransferase/2-methoxy-6-polyprenyl-1,4-benzoquinol methylase
MAQRGARAGELESAEVRSMFDGIAWIYDALNSAMTAGLHHRWRARAVDQARVGPGARVLDIATGTGDLALELARRVAPGGAVIGSDFSEGMLARAREKAGARDVVALDAELRFEWGDGCELPYADGEFDAALNGFGLRNFPELARGLTEMVRVVRPGGRVVVLEMTTPTRRPLSWFFALWFDRAVPLLGRIVGSLARLGARLRGAEGAEQVTDAYSYLPNSVKRWPGPSQLAVEMERAGLREISYILLAGGIIAIHAGTVPGKES